MDLLLQRRASGPTSTIGHLSEVLPGAGTHGLCFTCEDVVREISGQPVAEWKVPGATAIPAGRYAVIVTRSQRFGRRLPLLLNVPGFEGVRLHPGNDAGDTEGCLLPGMSTDGTAVGRSREACDKLQARIEAALERGERVTIEIRNAPAPQAVA